MAAVTELMSHPARRVGQPNTYTPQAMADTIASHFSDLQSRGEPITITDISLCLGLHRDTIHSYSKGEIGSTEELRRQYSDVIKWAYLCVENQREKRLMSKDYATAGVIFALKNHHGWRDEKYLNVESQVKQQLIVQLPTELTQHLEQQRGEKLGQIIEGEVVK